MIRCSRAAQPSSINLRKFSAAARAGIALGQFFAGHASAFDALGQLHFLVGGQQRDAADFLEVQADRVVRVDVGQVVIQRSINFRLGFGRLHGDQFVLGGLAGGGVFHKRNAGAQQRRKGLLQLLHILLRFGEEMQDVIERHIGLLPPQLDQTGNGRKFFFFVNDQYLLYIHLYVYPVFLYSEYTFFE